MPAIFPVPSPCMPMQPDNETPLSNQSGVKRNPSPHMAAAPRRVHRIVDVLGSLALIVLLSPLLAMVTLLVLLDVGAPPIVWRERYDRSGQPFKLYRFRTLKIANAGQEPHPTIDQRATPFGQILRRSRLDRLPHLINVLRGDVSFFGPKAPRT